MPPTATAAPSPTGGAIILNIELGVEIPIVNPPRLNPVYYNTPITIQRYTGSLSNTPVTIYSGVFTPVYIDVGDSLPKYLNFSTSYWYTITDPSGSYTVGPIIPAPELAVFSNYLDGVLFRLFSAGVSAIAVPSNFNPIRVEQAMPLTPGSDATKFPFVVMNLDLEQQDSLQIGEDVLFSQSNLNILPLNILRRYSINILSHSAQERDFYKDAVKGVIYTVMIALQQIGQNFVYDYQSSSTQVSEDLMMPGFYASTIMLEFTGLFNMTITTQLPLIEYIEPAITATTQIPSGIGVPEISYSVVVSG
jgi:hypothetical protein